MLNSALTVSESEIVLASRGALSSSTGCEAIGCPTPRVHPQSQQPTVPVTVLQPICNTLNTQLSELLVGFFYYCCYYSITIVILHSINLIS